MCYNIFLITKGLFLWQKEWTEKKTKRKLVKLLRKKEQLKGRKDSWV